MHEGVFSAFVGLVPLPTVSRGAVSKGESAAIERTRAMVDAVGRRGEAFTAERNEKLAASEGATCGSATGVTGPAVMKMRGVKGVLECPKQLFNLIRPNWRMS
jgi:hypothetical protein